MTMNARQREADSEESMHYTSWGGYSVSYRLATERHWREASADPGVGLIKTVARGFRDDSAKNPDMMATFRSPEGDRLRGRVAELREHLFVKCRSEAIARDGLFGAVSWWFNHGWVSDMDTWLLAATYWIRVLGGTHFGDLDYRDVEVIITHTANMTNPRCNAEGFDKTGGSLTLGLYPLLGLALSVPVAMYARRTGRPLLFLPMNSV
ncbi:hypothetical protein BV20DRAFT_982973 [Pilatotrama ljubarskyi]|nr:hypothetical protein BV20DRAFT_982973 [Pilatotrama ljubarskyi]